MKILTHHAKEVQVVNVNIKREDGNLGYLSIRILKESGDVEELCVFSDDDNAPRIVYDKESMGFEQGNGI